MAVNGQAYPIQLLDANGLPVGRAILIQYTDEDDQPGSGGGGGLPTGWSQSGDPADVQMSTGSLNGDDGAGATALIDYQGIQASAMDGSSISIKPIGLQVAAPAGNACYGAGGTAGATVALDAGGLHVTNFDTLVPGTPPAITGALSTVIDTAAKDVLTSIISALVGLGLATDGTT